MAELSIRLKIGNRDYPMRVSSEDEERIRKAGNILNEKIKKYRDQFGIEDNQDLLAMVAFDNQVEQLKTEETNTSGHDYLMNQVSRINQIISEAL